MWRSSGVRGVEQSRVGATLDMADRLAKEAVRPAEPCSREVGGLCMS